MEKMSKILRKRSEKFKTVGLSFALISAMAQASLGSENNENVALQGVEISESADDGYRAKTSEVGKTNTPILEIPQTVNVVTQQQLKDKKPETLAESL